MADKKNRMMQEFLAQKWKINDKGQVNCSIFNKYARDPNKKVYVLIKEILPNGNLLVKKISEDTYDDGETVLIDSSQIERVTIDVGSNPFTDEPWDRRIITRGYDLGTILSLIGESCYESSIKTENAYDIIDGMKIKEVNFNPYVLNGDEKLYYQRDFCWTLKDKQMLIESIYQHINCGMILLRKHSFNFLKKEYEGGNKEIGFWDVVDGKQRLGCIIDFIHDRIKDLHGNYFSDLSKRAQMLFRRSQCFSFGEMEEGTTDNDVIKAFLHINYTGKPISQEHIDYVKEISNKLKNGKCGWNTI